MSININTDAGHHLSASNLDVLSHGYSVTIITVIFLISPSIYHHIYTTIYIPPSIYHHLYITIYISSSIYHHLYIIIYISPSIYHHLYITIYISSSIYHHLYITIYISQSITQIGKTIKKPSTVLAGLQRLLVGVISLVLHLQIAGRFPVALLYSSDFINTVPYVQRCGVLILVMIGQRLKFYFAWKLAEGASILGGFGFQGTMMYDMMSDIIMI